MKPRLHAVTFGGSDKPSVRHRFVAALDWLSPHFDITSAPRYTDPGNAAVADLKAGDILLMQKRIPPLYWTLWRLRGLRAGVVYDFDDAIWTSPRGDTFARRWRTRARVGAIMRRADLVTAANEHLAGWARAFGADPIVVPMTIDSPGITAPGRQDGSIYFGWGGHPQSQYLLANIAAPLQAFFAGRSDRRFVLMSGSKPDLGFEFEWWPYDPDAERRFFAEVDVGLVPATNSSFDRGKSPIKILQHFANGRPVISNGAGATLELVDDSTAWLVKGNDSAGWLAALETAATDAEGRQRRGAAARARVKQNHDRSTVFERLVSALLALSERSARRGG